MKLFNKLASVTIALFVLSASACGQTMNEAVDYDLTVMGSDMVYATVFQMVTEPSNFLGKSFKITGKYNESYFEGTDTTYRYIVIADATACCSQGIEFLLQDGEYPDVGKEITVNGTLETYEEEYEGEIHTFVHLVNCEKQG